MVEEFVVPFRERTLDDPRRRARRSTQSSPNGAAHAREVASETLAAVYDRVGFVPARR